MYLWHDGSVCQVINGMNVYSFDNIGVSVPSAFDCRLYRTSVSPSIVILTGAATMMCYSAAVSQRAQSEAGRV